MIVMIKGLSAMVSATGVELHFLGSLYTKTNKPFF